MKLSEVLDQLSFGELSSLAASGIGLDDAETGDAFEGIPETDQPKVIKAVKMGLTALYSRFRLKENYYLLSVVDGKSIYEIDASDLLKIESIYQGGIEHLLNLKHDPESFRTLTYNKLAVPDTLDRDTYRVEYRANHPDIESCSGVYDPSCVDIELPIPYLQALLYFVAARLITPVGLSGDSQEGNNYAMMYESKCRELESHNYEIDSIGTTDMFIRNGWV